MLLWCLIEKSSLNLVLKKGIFLTKFHFDIKCYMEISRKGLLHFYQETSSLIGNQTNHRTNMFLPYKSNSCYESDYGCICILTYGKTCSVPLNILSSVYIIKEKHMQLEIKVFSYR